jgi:hypothetical protein
VAAVTYDPNLGIISCDAWCDVFVNLALMGHSSVAEARTALEREGWTYKRSMITLKMRDLCPAHSSGAGVGSRA